jgi:MOSC domain-containing protein YiiM
MVKQTGTLVSIHTTEDPDRAPESRESVKVELDGLAGEKHRGFTRIAQSWDPEPTGTPRRNERQWSGISVEELALIGERMDLVEPLGAGTLYANVCVEGIPDFSKLPKGSRLVFPSGAVLLVEEENPPCAEMGDEVAEVHTTNSGEPVAGKLFPRFALGLRGVVGIVDVGGEIEVGDRIVVEPPRR